MKPLSKTQSTLGLIGWITLTFCAPLFSITSLPGSWYAGLKKPSWNPPPWIFGPAWTLLYILMACAAWMVWKRGGFKAQRVPLMLYLLQLALNAAWTPIFFGMHQMGAALAVIIALWITILYILLCFWRVSTLAGTFFVPYLAWVSFATFLNFTLWKLNPQ